MRQVPKKASRAREDFENRSPRFPQENFVSSKASRSSIEDLQELSTADVRRMAQLLGVPVGEEDLQEVTFRLGALFDEHARLSELNLSQVEAIPVVTAGELNE